MKNKLLRSEKVRESTEKESSNLLQIPPTANIGKSLL
jgi:hypothetical protein